MRRPLTADSQFTGAPMSAKEQQQHPQDQEDPRDGESRSKRVEHPGNDKGPDVEGRVGKKGAPVGHWGRV
jgi:hypothetical protein